MDETFFQLHYHLAQPERLFDLAQGIQARRMWLKHWPRSRGIPFTRWSRRLLRQGLLILLLAVLVALLPEPSHLLLGLLLGLGALELLLYVFLRRSYRRVLRLFRENNGPNGCLTLDADGIHEQNEKGPATDLSWAEWDCCIATPEVIVLLFRPPVNLLILLPYSQDSALTLEHAARAFGREGTVYRRRG